MYISYGADSFCFSVHFNAILSLNVLMHEEQFSKNYRKPFVARLNTIIVKLCLLNLPEFF